MGGQRWVAAAALAIAACKRLLLVQPATTLRALPDTTRVWNFMDHFREEGVGADWLSMPEYFKSHGMLTLGSGK